jgi:hypothetical protein
MAVLNFDLVANLHLASATTQLHPMVADIESMREMAIFTPGDPESHWYDRFGSLRPPLPYAKLRHVSRPVRVTVVGCVGITATIFVVAFVVVAFVLLFVFFLIGLLPKENAGVSQAIFGFWIEAIWMYSAHAQYGTPRTVFYLVPEQTGFGILTSANPATITRN